MLNFLLWFIFYQSKVDEYGREVYKLVKQFTNMARKEKELKEKSSKDTIRKKNKEEQEEEEVFAPLKVAANIQEAVKEFKVHIWSVSWLRDFVKSHWLLHDDGFWNVF